jgi:putative CocE/NonD family hydrolase
MRETSASRRDFIQAASLLAGATLLSGSTADAGADAPKLYDVNVLRGVMIPMRDGVKLAADLYVPSRNGRPLEERLPALLMRIPYDRTKAFINDMRFFAERGYLAVTQDTRGRYGSEGKFVSFLQEPEDGYDTIEWLATHERCNGKVGMYGVSYMAWVQYEAAVLNPPALATITPNAGPINGFKYSMHDGGTLTLSMLQYQVYMASTSQEAQKDPKITRAIQTMLDGEDFLRWAMVTPWRRGQTPLAMVPQYEDVAFKYFFDNVDYNEFWRDRGLSMDEQIDKFPDIPTHSTVGWFEGYTRSIVDSYQMLVKRKPTGPHFLLIGPWSHNNTRPSCGDVNFGPAAAEVPGVGSYLEMHHQWYNRHLRGEKNANVGSPVKIFIMGGGDGRKGEGGRLNHGGHWHIGDIWPPKDSRPARFYLHESGRLSQEKPQATTASSSYTYDPRNTVSSDFRCQVNYGPARQRGSEGMGPRDQIQLATLPGHGTPGLPIAARADVMVFQTEPLPKALTVAGNNAARLFISSDAPDTDFYVKVIDVYPPSDDYPPGYAFPVTDGILRARYRESFSEPKLLEAGKVYELTIPLHPTANQFAAGHRIRVDITSSCFPSFDPNRNTGRPNDRTWRIANNTVHHDTEHASCVELGVLE